jgi:hypothetical protein
MSLAPDCKVLVLEEINFQCKNSQNFSNGKKLANNFWKICTKCPCEPRTK